MLRALRAWGVLLPTAAGTRRRPVVCTRSVAVDSLWSGGGPDSRLPMREPRIPNPESRLLAWRRRSRQAMTFGSPASNYEAPTVRGRDTTPAACRRVRAPSHAGRRRHSVGDSESRRPSPDSRRPNPDSRPSSWSRLVTWPLRHHSHRAGSASPEKAVDSPVGGGRRRSSFGGRCSYTGALHCRWALAVLLDYRRLTPGDRLSTLDGRLGSRSRTALHTTRGRRSCAAARSNGPTRAAIRRRARTRGGCRTRAGTNSRNRRRTTTTPTRRPTSVPESRTRRCAHSPTGRSDVWATPMRRGRSTSSRRSGSATRSRSSTDASPVRPPDTRHIRTQDRSATSRIDRMCSRRGGDPTEGSSRTARPPPPAVEYGPSFRPGGGPVSPTPPPLLNTRPLRCRFHPGTGSRRGLRRFEGDRRARTACSGSLVPRRHRVREWPRRRRLRGTPEAAPPARGRRELPPAR